MSHHAPRRAILAAGALAAMLGAGHDAAAHAVVVASDPPTGAALDGLPSRVTVRFNSRIDHARSRLMLVGPQAEALVLDTDPGRDPVAIEATVGNPVANPVAAGGNPGVSPSAPGAWRLRWQVLAVDGHITRGDIPFTIRPATPLR